MATFGNDYVNSKASTDVNVVGFAGNALDGILKAIQATKEATDKLCDKIEENADEQGKRDKSEKVASIASERRQRAANAAIHGKVDKGLGAIGILTNTLKDIGKKLLDMLGSMAKESLRAYDETTRSLRRQFLTTAQIEQNLLKADKAKMALEEMGIKVNSSETKNIVSALVEAQVDTSQLSESQLAAITMMNKTMGIDVKTALSIVKTSKDPSKIISMAVQASDTVGRETTAKLMQSVNETWFARYAQTVGGTENAISEFQKAAKSLDAALGDYGLGADTQKSLLETALKISSGQIEKAKQDDIANMLAISGDAMKSPEKLVEGIQKMITRTDLTQQQKLDNLRVLNGVEGINQEFITSLQNAIVANSIGKYKQKTIRSEEDNKEAINQAQKGGRVGGFIDKMMTGLNVATGGIFSDMSAGLNEWFGESIGVEEIVSNGFKLVCTLLAAIAGSILISKGGGLLASLVTGIAGLTGLGGGIAGITGGIAGITGGIPGLGGGTQDIPDGPNGRDMPNGPNGRGGTNAIRGARALKGLKALGVVGAVAGVGLTAAELYSIHSAPDTSVASESSSEKFKEEEKKIQDEIKTAKTVGVIAETGIAAGGALAGAKIGAMIGAAGGPLGIAAGALIGTAIGGVGSIVVGNITDSIEKTKNVEIGVKNIEDLDSQLKDLDRLIAKEGDQDTKRKRELLELRAQVLKDLQDATKSNINTLITNFNSHNEDFSGNADAMSQIAEKIKQVQAALNENVMKQATGAELSETELSDIKKYKKDLSNLRQAMTGLAGGEFKVEEGEALDDAIKRIAADVRGDGYFDTREDVEYNAAKNQTEMEKFLKERALDRLTNGVMHESLDDLKKYDVKIIEAFVKEQKLGAGLSEKAIHELTGEVIKMAKGDKEFNEWQMRWEQQNANKPATIELASGGVFNSATNAIIGEAGKEAVVPLERPDAMKRVLGTLSASEKFKLIKALLGSNSKKLTWDLLASVMLSTLGIGKEISSGPIIANDEFVKNVLQGAAAQKGKSYAEIVCNQLVEAALKHAGFKTPTTGIVTKHFNHKDMHLILNDPINGISPNDPKLVPGMILFSHPFTQAEADELNRRKGGKRKAGDPGHMGIYAGDGLWWNSTSSKNTLDYSTGKGIRTSDSRGIGVALTKPFRKGTYKLYAAGYYDGMFSASEVSTANVSKNISYEPNVNKANGILSDAEINEILSEAGVSNSAAMKQYIEQAKQLVVNANSKDDIIAVLLEIARYLKGIATSPVNKPPMMSVARPYTPAYGT